MVHCPWSKFTHAKAISMELIHKLMKYQLLSSYIHRILSTDTKAFWTIHLILSFPASFCLSELFWSSVFVAFFNMLLTTLGTTAFCIAKGLPLQSCSLPPTCSFLPIHMSSQDGVSQVYPILSTAVFFPWHSCLLFISWTCKQWDCCYKRFSGEATITDVRTTPSFSPFLISTSGYTFRSATRLNAFAEISNELAMQHLLQSTCASSNSNSIISRNNPRGILLCLDIKYSVIVGKVRWGSHLLYWRGCWGLDTPPSDLPMRKVFPSSFSHHLSLYFSFSF